MPKKAQPAPRHAADSVIAKLLGPLPTMASVEAMGGHPGTWLDNFQAKEPGHYEFGTSQGTNYWANANYYDRAKIYYWMSFATEGSESEVWLEKGHELALNYRKYYAPSGGVSAHWSMPQGVFLHWLLTQDEVSKTWCVNCANTLSTGYMYSQLGLIGGEMDNRIQARVLEAEIIAWLITEDEYWADKLREALPLILQTQAPNGGYPFTQIQNGTTKPFMVGLLHDAFLLYARAFENDARIAPAMEKGNDYLWREEWVPEAKGFRYCVGEGTEGAGPAPDLNNLIINGFDATGTGDVDAIFEGSLSAWLDGDKQFNQAYSFAYQTIGRMDGAVSAWEGDDPTPPDPPEPPDPDLDVDRAVKSLNRAQAALAASAQSMALTQAAHNKASAAVANALRHLQE